MDLRPLADGGLAFGAADPSLGVLGEDAKILWRQDPTKADFRNQRDKSAVSGDGTRSNGARLEPSSTSRPGG
jgi:hypothetical protein